MILAQFSAAQCQHNATKLMPVYSLCRLSADTYNLLLCFQPMLLWHCETNNATIFLNIYLPLDLTSI